MKPLTLARENWRVTMLVVLVALSCFFLFVPGASLGQEVGDQNATEDTGLTNLEYGIDLSGGSRIRAPVAGMTAENVDVSVDERRTVSQEVANELGLDTNRVRTSPQQGTVEVFDENVTEAQFESALDAAGVNGEDVTIRSGVTEDTRNTMVDVLNDRLGSAGFGGSSVRQAQVGGQWYIVIESSSQSLEELRQITQNRGVVQFVAHYPIEGENGTTYDRQVALRHDQIASVGTVDQTQDGRYGFGVTVKESHAEEYQQIMVDTGLATSGERCLRSQYPEQPSQWNYCQLVVYDDEIVTGLTMNTNLGESMQSGEWAREPTFQVTTPDQQSAENIRVSVEAGSLPATLDLGENSNVDRVEPSLAQQFKTNSLITGVLAVLTVVAVVFLRYGDPRVAAPMSLTALSEVLILLGFAAAIRWQLDLSHIAGLIAVVGTGVDDLVIIADEVLNEGDVNSQRVFDNRFRKAFWVIGAAAATTIIAMSPLAVLSLGDLRGFAIVTILGVLIGVFITRPAYGNILRSITTDK
jgi:preprotein translocase subunit SecD